MLHKTPWLLILIAVGGQLGAASAQTTMRCSASAAGAPGNAASFSPCLSPDGARVDFGSWAHNLTPATPFPTSGILRYERASGAVTLLSLSSSGAPANLDCDAPCSSADGRFVAFSSAATNLAPNDNNNLHDVFVRDLQTGITQCVSVTPAGIPGNSWCYPTGISDDGRFVCFASLSSDLIAGDSNFSFDIFVRDLTTQTTQAASMGLGGALGNAHSLKGGMSADGRFVVFHSNANNLVANDTNGTTDIFLRDMVAGSTQRMNLSAQGAQANSFAEDPHISRDGRWTVFSSGDAQLVPGDTNGTADIFVKDRVSGSIEIASLSSAGAPANGASFMPTGISSDGRFVGFTSSASNLHAGDSNNAGDIFIRDRQAGTTWRASQDSFGSDSNGNSFQACVSDDGQTVVYASDAANLVANDENSANDIFLSSAQSLGVVTVAGLAKVNSAGCRSLVNTVGFPRASGSDDAFVIAVVKVLNNKSGLFFWGRQPANLPFGGGTLLVQPPLVRTTVQVSGGSAQGSDCTGLYSYRFSQSYMASHTVFPGNTIYGQFWSRDPGFPAPDNIGLSEALRFTVSP